MSVCHSGDCRLPRDLRSGFYGRSSRLRWGHQREARPWRQLSFTLRWWPEAVVTGFSTVRETLSNKEPGASGNCNLCAWNDSLDDGSADWIVTTNFECPKAKWIITSVYSTAKQRRGIGFTASPNFTMFAPNAEAGDPWAEFHTHLVTFRMFR